jgi:hypothetical protein
MIYFIMSVRFKKMIQLWIKKTHPKSLSWKERDFWVQEKVEDAA